MKSVNTRTSAIGSTPVITDFMSAASADALPGRAVNSSRMTYMGASVRRGGTDARGPDGPADYRRVGRGRKRGRPPAPYAWRRVVRCVGVAVQGSSGHGCFG